MSNTEWIKCRERLPEDGTVEYCQTKKDLDAADAIEYLNHLVDLNTERCEALRKQLREAHESYEKHLNELEAQLPKEGEWIPNSPFTGNCSECGGDGNLKDKYCSNCGSRMRKGEQE